VTVASSRPRTQDDLPLIVSDPAILRGLHDLNRVVSATVTVEVSPQPLTLLREPGRRRHPPTGVCGIERAAEVTRH
jgi:hypothetical protein